MRKGSSLHGFPFRICNGGIQKWVPATQDVGIAFDGVVKAASQPSAFREIRPDKMFRS